MAASRAALYGSLLALAIWIVEALVTWQAGGLERSAGEGPLFLVGLLTYMGAAMALGAALLVGRPLWMRAVSAAVVTILALLLFTLADWASGELLPASAGWVNEEAGLWAAAFVLVAISWFALRRAERYTVATTT